MNASARVSLVHPPHLVKSNGKLTGSDEHQGSSSVDDTSSVLQDGGRMTTVHDGLVNTPEKVGGEGFRSRTVQLRISTDCLDLEPSDNACLHIRDRPSVLSGVGATECQLAIVDRFLVRGLKRHGNKVRLDSVLTE